MSRVSSCVSQTANWLRLDSSHSDSPSSSSASTSHPDPVAKTTTPPNHQSPLLQIPTDVLLLLADHLTPASRVSLALTCRSAYTLCFPHRSPTLSPSELQSLLPLLERDPLMKGTFFCHLCNILHPFRHTWGPHSEAEVEDDRRGSKRMRKCAGGRRDMFSPGGNSLELTFHHARLVMNRHLYGEEYGLDLDNICLDQVMYRGRNHRFTFDDDDEEDDEAITPIHASTSAQILNDNLFLRRTYSFTVPNTPSTIQAFRKATGHKDFHICEHVSFLTPASAHRENMPEIQARPEGNAEGFVPCTDSRGACALCLMDYDITVTAPRSDSGIGFNKPPSSTPSGEEEEANSDSSDEPQMGEWTFTIRAYHNLGTCRTPQDWRWARFTECSGRQLGFPNRPNRKDPFPYEKDVADGMLQGSVRRMWVDAGERLC